MSLRIREYRNIKINSNASPDSRIWKYKKQFNSTSVNYIFVLILAVVISEKCHIPSDCQLEACANNGTVLCDHGVCTCDAHQSGRKLFESYCRDCREGSTPNR